MRADLTKVRQTLFNLLSNASKFTEQGKHHLIVERQTRTHSGERIRFAVDRHRHRHDRGATRPGSFRPSPRPTPPPLANTAAPASACVISRKFCQMMGGDIAGLQRAPSKGTKFIVDLPAAVVEAASGKVGLRPAASSLPGASKLVLVIDDDQDAAGNPQAQPERRRATRSSSPTAARRASSSRGKIKPSAITLDVMMPGMDGWSVLTALKSDPAISAIPVIMVTMLQDRQLGFALGAAEFLTKPVNHDKLREVLANTAASRRPTPWWWRTIPATGSSSAACWKRKTSASWKLPTAVSALEQVADGTARHHPARSDDARHGRLRIPEPPAPQARLLRHIPVVVITAKDLTSEDRERLTGSVSQVIQKGAVDRDRLLHDIHSMLEKKV